MLVTTWRDKKQNELWAREQIKAEDISLTIKNKKWTWAGQWRRTDNR